MRRFAEPPQNSQYYKHRPGAYGIFMRHGQILLTAQIADQVEWQLPGGGIEHNEHPMEALSREAFEETGWRVQIARKVTIYKRYVYMPDYQIHAEKICHIYAGRAILRLGEATEPDHFPAFFDPETALEIMVNEGDKAALSQFMKTPPTFML